jgi:aspartyl-tRNA(Asn)/glutamyl-tRNA(Gln) amidotransferase subunit B
MPTPKTIANIICGPLLAISNKNNLSLNGVITQTQLIELADLFENGKINNQGITKILEFLIEKKESKAEKIEKIADKLHLLQVTDTDFLVKIVQEIITENVPQVQDYLAGKVQILGFLVGQCMKKAKGQGNPQLFNELLVQEMTLISK